MLGVVAGAWIATQEARRRGENPQHVWDMLFWAVGLGFVGARLYHVVSSPPTTEMGLHYYLRAAG